MQWSFVFATACIGTVLSVSGCTNKPVERNSSHSPPASSIALPATGSAKPKSSAPPTGVSSLPPMNVIVLVVDGLRDDMPWNGYERQIAPNLTRLYAKSVRYERGYSISSYTSKSVGGLLSGQYPESLVRMSQFFTIYGKNNLMLGEMLHRGGVRCLGIQADVYFTNSGVEQGFDEWKLIPEVKLSSPHIMEITSKRHVELIIEQLSKKENTTGRFFAYYHFMDPHYPYKRHPEAPDWGNGPRDRYDQEVWYTDFYIQKLLDFIWSRPWGKRTAIIFTADHGEAFGEHHFYKHAFELYEVLVRVPLFIYIPGVKPRTVKRWRSAIDLAPTILDLMHVPKPKPREPSQKQSTVKKLLGLLRGERSSFVRLQGVSLLPELLGKDVPQRPILLDIPADTENIRHRALISPDGYKIVHIGHHGVYKLYNVRKDPGELHELSDEEPEVKKRMIERLNQAWAKIPVIRAQGGGERPE